MCYLCLCFWMHSDDWYCVCEPCKVQFSNGNLSKDISEDFRKLLNTKLNLLNEFSVSVSPAQNAVFVFFSFAVDWWVANGKCCILTKQILIWVYDSRHHRIMELLGPRSGHLIFKIFMIFIVLKWYIFFELVLSEWISLVI